MKDSDREVKNSPESGKDAQAGPLTLGILAHVDAGKTTLSEAILYLTGRIRTLGRVDHQDAYLDHFALERERGITIFSKQAQVELEGLSLTLLDTPGHVDFSAEMERTLQVLDFAVLIISGPDGVQSHVETLWRLLARYEIPTFLFVNKMDLVERTAREGTDTHAALMEELRAKLDQSCVDFTLPPDSEQFQEQLAMCDESLLESYLAGTAIDTDDIRDLIDSRQVFPCYFGSALKLQGVQELLDGIRRYTRVPAYPETFGARIYKISRDAQGNRLTHLKVTGGTLHVRDVLRIRGSGCASGRDDGRDGVREEDQVREEKVTQVRIYSGANFDPVQEAPAGTVCAVTGLDHSFAGQGLGAEPEGELPLLEPVLSYRIELPSDVDVHQAFRETKELEEEEPQLHIVWNEPMQEIRAQLMGEVQTEVLTGMIRERFGYAVKFNEGSIVYRETIASPVVGMGHFEPLRHYAEVHLLMEPLERGSGLEFDSLCSEDALAGNWQHLILTHLEERTHPGVLTGSEITDMRITLVAGRAHEKHTEGGDFRQATYRAVRQGLCRAESILLEPVYRFRLEVPQESAGRALADITRMYGTADAPQISGDRAVIEGSAPVSTMRGYQNEVAAYTKGRGHLACRLLGYEACHNAEEVIEARGYDAQTDADNPCGSVFCAHGAGFVVSWEQVPDYVHIKGTDAYAEAARARIRQEHGGDADERTGLDHGMTRANVGGGYPGSAGQAGAGGRDDVDDDELRAIFERTYGPVKRERNHSLYSSRRKKGSGSDWAGPETHRKKPAEDLEECLLVDGYNIIFAWDELKELSKDNLEAARMRLLDLMSNYQGYKGMHTIVVFDAYRVSGHETEVSKYHNLYVVYTKEAETADQYIEKTVHEVHKKYHVTVATSDGLEQAIIFGEGAVRLSARELHEELELMQKDLEENYLGKGPKGPKRYLLDGNEEIINSVCLGHVKMPAKPYKH